MIMWIEIHDKDGLVNMCDLTDEGAKEAIRRTQDFITELEEQLEEMSQEEQAEAEES